MYWTGEPDYGQYGRLREGLKQITLELEEFILVNRGVDRSTSEDNVIIIILSVYPLLLSESSFLPSIITGQSTASVPFAAARPSFYHKNVMPALLTSVLIVNA